MELSTDLTNSRRTPRLNSLLASPKAWLTHDKNKLNEGGRFSGAQECDRKPEVGDRKTDPLSTEVL
jgi:hypothetical protein